MKKFIKPTIDLIILESEEIICTSGTPVEKTQEHSEVPEIDFPF